jgi:hypothetical protein
MPTSYASPTPRNGPLGMIADLLKKANSAMTIQSPNYRPGDMHAENKRMMLNTLSPEEKAIYAKYGDETSMERGDDGGSYLAAPPTKSIEVTQIKGPNNQEVPLHAHDKLLDYLNTHHADSKVQSGGLVRQNIIDTKHSNMSVFENEPEYLRMLNEHTNGNRFVSTEDADRLYAEFVAKEYGSEPPYLSPSQEQHNSPYGGNWVNAQEEL